MFEEEVDVDPWYCKDDKLGSEAIAIDWDTDESLVELCRREEDTMLFM